jgi:hypothetical protein
MPSLPMSPLSPAIDWVTAPLFAQFAQVGPAHLPFYWHLPMLVVLVSLVYSATRHDGWSAIVREAVLWGSRLTAFLVSIVFVLWVVARFFIGP